MRIYTKFGDDGNTQLLGGQQTRKTDVRVAVCGGLDEISAVLGLAAATGPPDPLAERIRAIQSELLTLGSCVAAIGADTRIELPQLAPANVIRLESEIDEMDAVLLELKNFILPGGDSAAATLHVARAVCRRTERDLVRLTDSYPDVDSSLFLMWLNRLGDWCFVAARYVNHQQETAEPIWRASESNQ
ncbi:MAG: cob(I)yrinic acid a,c-diamide adenosyltransferase [Pirellulaceae bacterium]